jgi:hypothetical protein
LGGFGGVSRKKGSLQGKNALRSSEAVSITDVMVNTNEGHIENELRKNAESFESYTQQENVILASFFNGDFSG